MLKGGLVLIWKLDMNLVLTLLFTHLKLSLMSNPFQTSKMPIYQTMWEFMSGHRSEVMVNSNNEGIQKVIKENGKYAYMMESSSIQYIIERNCKVTQIGGNLDTKVHFPLSLIEFHTIGIDK